MGDVNATVEFVKDWCNDDSHGYDQSNRWGSGCDCSSLMYMAGDAGGFGVGTGRGNTRTMLDDFTAAGYTAVPFDGNLTDLEPGDIMLNCADHTEMYVGDGCFGGAHIDENGGIAGGCPGDQTGHEVSIVPAYVFSNGWDYVLCPPHGGEVSDDSWHVNYQLSTAEDGELPEVSDGEEAGIGSHWPNGMRITIPGAGVTYQPCWLHSGWDEQTYSDGQWAKRDNDYICGWKATSSFPDANYELAQQCHVSPDSDSHGDTWWDVQTDMDTGDEMDGYAGEPGSPIDLCKMWIQPV